MGENARIPMGAGGVLPLAWLAFGAGLMPIVVVHACYAVSANAGLVPGCVPYLTGCTSISAAGRYGAAYFMFKGGMIPAAVLMAAFWPLGLRWLRELGGAASRTANVMVALGVVSAAFLVLYTVYLGSKGDFYNLMRRYGVNVHLSFAVLAQILMTRELLRLPDAARRRLPRGTVGGAVALLLALLALGLASIPVGNFMPDKDRAENVIEWWFAAGMACYYLVVARAWRATGFGAVPCVRHDADD